MNIKRHNKIRFLSILGFIALSLLVFYSGLSAQDTKVVDRAKSIENLRKKQPSRPVDERLAKEWDLLQFKIKKIKFYLRFYEPSELLLKLVDGEIKQSEILYDSLEKKTPSKIKDGIAEEAYYDDTDGSVQPFIRYLPTNYDKNKKYPLIVYLHGYSPYLNIVNWAEMPEGLEQLAKKLDACIVMPFARSNTDFQGIGEQDVLNVIKEMEKRYNIDSNRIMLFGMSMGGMGVWTIGSHYPHLFSGLIILSGRGDFYFWHKIKPETLPEYQRYLINKEFAAAHLPNLNNIPIRSFHGVADTLIPVEEARHMKELLGKINPLFIHKEIAEGDHWIHEEAFTSKDLKEWLQKLERKTPESFEFISYHPSYNQAYWIYIDELIKNGDFGKLKVEVKNNKISIEATGIKRLIVDRNLMPERITKFPIIKENDFELKETPNYTNNRKPYPWGPIKDAFLQPFIFINSGVENKTENEKFNQQVFKWDKFTQSSPRVKKEKELTEKEKKEFNLFLFGEPEKSPMIREILKDTPIEITRDEYIIGKEKFPRSGNGLFFKYPSPWNPERSVIIQSGIPWGDNVSENHIYDSLPGYIIYTGTTDPKDPFGGNKALIGGFFDKKGKIRP